MDSGTAYGRPKPSYDAMLVEVGHGTPGGEMLRRYWHPLAVTADVTTRPQKVRVLGEDLILFRDGDGRPGEAVQAGRDPLGVIFDPARALLQVEAGNFTLEPAG